ncbi:MAG: apolipoprotein N-acyltransferase [Deltaproteobacteria bacterium]
MTTKFKIALVLVSAACFYFSTGLETVWPLAWIAPIPLLYLAFKMPRAKRGALTAGIGAWAAYFLGGLNMFAYYHDFLPLPMLFGVLAILALVFAAVVLVARFAYLRLAPAAAVFAFPALWTAWEFLLSRVSVHGTWGSLAYTQTDFLPLLQIVSVTGLFGVTFVLTLVPSAVAVALARRKWTALALPTLLVALVMGFGAWRLRGTANAQLAKTAVRVGLAATDNLPGDAFVTKDSSKALDIVRGYADRVRSLAAQGATVIVLPEKFVGATPADFDEIKRILSDAARDCHVTVIAGVNQVEPRPPRNLALVFAPSGELEVEYDKRHMLPGPESGYVIGEKPGLFLAEGTPCGVEICKDMDFPRWARVYGARGVQLLAVPAWDFVTDGRLHSRMAVVRGVENGFAIARAARNGLLTASDAYGRILGDIRSNTQPEAMLVRDLPPGPGATFYTRHGDWFGWLCVAGAAGLWVAAGLIRRS